MNAGEKRDLKELVIDYRNRNKEDAIELIAQYGFKKPTIRKYWKIFNEEAESTLRTPPKPEGAGVRAGDIL